MSDTPDQESDKPDQEIEPRTFVDAIRRRTGLSLPEKIEGQRSMEPVPSELPERPSQAGE